MDPVLAPHFTQLGLNRHPGGVRSSKSKMLPQASKRSCISANTIEAAERKAGI